MSPPPPPPQYSQSNDEEPYYILKTHTCNTINILIEHQLFNDDFINDEMYQRSYSVINRRRSLLDDQQLIKFINIYQPGSRLVRQFIFNLQLLLRS
jgi:hypothetical protein